MHSKSIFYFFPSATRAKEACERSAASFEGALGCVFFDAVMADFGFVMKRLDIAADVAFGAGCAGTGGAAVVELEVATSIGSEEEDGWVAS